MSRKALLMSSGACVMDEDSQSANEVCTSAIDDKRSDRDLSPTAIVSQHETTARRPPSDLTPREIRRKGYYRRKIDPNNKSLPAPNNGRNGRRAQRAAYEQYAQPNRQHATPMNNPQDGSGPVYMIHNHFYHYHVMPDQIGPGSTQSFGLGHAPSQMHGIAPSQLQNSRSIDAAMALPLPLVALGAHGQAGSPPSRAQSQIQAQQQYFGTAPAVVQQQSLSSSPRMSANSGHSNFFPVVVPPSSVSAEPRPITRTRTMPVRTYGILELSRSC